MDTEDCEICQFAKTYHTWPTLDDDLNILNPGDKMPTNYEGRKIRITHCGDSTRAGIVGCHRSWSSLSQGHCVVEGCHEQLSSATASDFHWVGGHHHPSDNPSDASRLVAVEDTFGTVWQLPQKLVK